MTAIVTGGAGFIGSHLVDALVADGREVVVIDDLSSGSRENLEGALAAGARLVEADVRNAEAITATVARVRPGVVFHLAAQMDVRRSTREPAVDAAINAIGTLNLLDAARDCAIGRFVNVSTGGAIYGEVEVLPAPESHPSRPDAPYGVSKSAAEGYCRVYRSLHGLSTASLRPGNVYGPRQNPHGEAGVVAIFCGKLVDGERPTVFGDGRQTRDFVFVEDVVAALLAAADCDADGPFNIGTGIETNMLGLVGELAKHSKDRFEPVFEAARPGEIGHIALDSSRARKELGWSARTTFSEGVSRTLAAIRASASDR